MTNEPSPREKPFPLEDIFSHSLETHILVDNTNKWLQAVHCEGFAPASMTTDTYIVDKFAMKVPLGAETVIGYHVIFAPHNNGDIRYVATGTAILPKKDSSKL